ncbi:MAG: PIG-L family deacetylase [Rhodanobacteraceae bacterium]
MSRQLHFDARHRVLVFAPHPDDETIAAGALIQSARRAGAAIRVVFATDGDNNPWPQRWLERRWHIGEVERVRWGARRRREAFAAAQMLGLDEESLSFLGWPDQGLTNCLMRDAKAEDELAEQIVAFAPSHVVLPTLSDCHPDHSALRVMLDLALSRSGVKHVRLGYVLHGPALTDATHTASSDAAAQACKYAALAAYRTQTSLSQNRLSRLARRVEAFVAAERDVPHAHDSADLLLRLKMPSFRAKLRRHDLLMVLAGVSSSRRLQISLPPSGELRHGVTLEADDAVGGEVHMVRKGDKLDVRLPGAGAGLLQGYVKIERAWPRLVIFDAAGWHSIDECPASDREATIVRGEQVPARALS